MPEESGFHELPSGRTLFIHGRCIVRDAALKEIRAAAFKGDVKALETLRGKHGISQDNMRRIVTGIAKEMGLGEG